MAATTAPLLLLQLVLVVFCFPRTMRGSRHPLDDIDWDDEEWGEADECDGWE